MDAEAVERVLDAMMDVPVNIDKRALRDDLGSAGSMFRTTRELDSNPLAKERFRRARDMQVTAKKLASLVKADDDDAGFLRRFYPGREPDPMAILMRMVKAADRAMENRREFVEGGKPVRVLRLKWSPFVWLIGKDLSEIFEKHFGQRASHTRDPYREIIKGPFVDFAEAVLKEFGESCKRATIAAALGEWRRGKPRRKG